MPKNSAKIFFIADIVGEAGLTFLETMLPPLIEKHSPDFIIANGENSHEGRGINREIVQKLYDLGVNVITGGNHSFDKWKIFSYMKSDPNLLRPLNYPKGNAGYGYGIYELPDSDKKISVLNLQGRTYMQPIDDPFSTSDWAIEKIKREKKEARNVSLSRLPRSYGKPEITKTRMGIEKIFEWESGKK
jgi:calcineurin-like phosphoesterase